MPGGESRQINDGGLRATESGLRHFQTWFMQSHAHLLSRGFFVCSAIVGNQSKYLKQCQCMNKKHVQTF